MINCEIRLLELNDLEHWTKMRHTLWPSGSMEEHRGEIKELLGNDHFAAWGAWKDQKPIGFAEVYIRPFANGCEERPVPFLEGIWIDPTVRNSGVGRQLLEVIEKWCSSKGFKEIGSDALIDNTASHKAHERWGFEETERVVYYRKRL